MQEMWARYPPRLTSTFSLEEKHLFYTQGSVGSNPTRCTQEPMNTEVGDSRENCEAPVVEVSRVGVHRRNKQQHTGL